MSVIATTKSNLESRYDALCDVIQQLATNVESLAGELSPVLGPSYPTPAGEDTDENPEQSTLAHNIQQQTHVVTTINQTVHDIRRRLEV